MIRISLWALLVAAFGIFGTLLFIVHSEAVAAGKRTIELERIVANESIKEKDLDRRLDDIEKKQDEMRGDIKTLIKLHMHNQGQ